ncbi:transcription elongation factor GreA [Kamptonema cortianum]|nr:transcription elongation factor GreA [Geitlerinema splendidum]MDK3158515.1 transcription elongation factor GreA [Kamptonema cortianum]
MHDQDLEQSAPVLLTAAGHARLKAELHFLTTDKRKEIAERIRESKDHGEFSEDNNELDEVKQEQAIIESRILELKTILSGADILDPKEIPTDQIGLGSKVCVVDEDRGFDFEVRLVASIEANPDEDTISEESPLGQSLMGLKVGGVAEFDGPAGRMRYTVKKISA